MATFTLFDEFINNLGKKLIDLNADTFKAYLSTATPDVAAHDEKADLAEVSTGNGYAGPVTLTTTFAETGSGTGVWRFDCDDIAFGPASGGDIASNRYIIIYDDTSTNDKLVGFYDRGSASVIAAGQTLTVAVASGLIDIAEA